MEFIIKKIADYVMPLLAVTLLAMGYFAGASLTHAKYERKELALMKEQQARFIQDQAKAVELEERLAKQRGKIYSLNRELEKERENRIYLECIVPANGLRIANDALSGNPAR